MGYEARCAAWIDRASFAGMLGDCYEVAVRAAFGQRVGGLTGDGDVERWEDATREECAREAAFALDAAARHALELCASGRAMEAVSGVLRGDDFFAYMKEHAERSRELQGAYEGRKLACEVELGLTEEGR